MTTSRQIFSYNQRTNGSRAPVTAWSNDSTWLAVGNEHNYIYVLDKRGKLVAEKELPLRGRVEAIDWDYEDDLIAILIEGASSIFLWSAMATNLIDELQF